VIVDVEQYEDANSMRKAMGFDIISKVSGVIDWEIVPQKQLAETSNIEELEEPLVKLLDELPLPVSIVRRTDGTYTWKWQLASGQADTFLEAAKAAIAHVMKAYVLIRSELIN
jgi:hypothetical protein